MPSARPTARAPTGQARRTCSPRSSRTCRPARSARRNRRTPRRRAPRSPRRTRGNLGARGVARRRREIARHDAIKAARCECQRVVRTPQPGASAVIELDGICVGQALRERRRRRADINHMPFGRPADQVRSQWGEAPRCGIADRRSRSPSTAFTETSLASRELEFGVKITGSRSVQGTLPAQPAFAARDLSNLAQTSMSKVSQIRAAACVTTVDCRGGQHRARRRRTNVFFGRVCACVPEGWLSIIDLLNSRSRPHLLPAQVLVGIARGLRHHAGADGRSPPSAGAASSSSTRRGRSLAASTHASDGTTIRARTSRSSSARSTST